MSQITSFGSGGGGGGSLDTLTGNSGGAVNPTANNIDIVGDGGITVVGDDPSSTLTISMASIYYEYTNVNSSPYVVLDTDQYISVDCSGGAITLQFPNAATASQAFIIKDRTGSAATNNITITTVGGAVNIDGATSYVMNTNYQAVQLIGNGTTYEIF